MSPTDSFQRLLSHFRNGNSEEAAEIIVQRFTARLAGLLASRMTPGLRQRLGPEDAAQSVFLAFFVKHREGLWELPGWEAVWAVLAHIAVWRVCNDHKKHQAARRSLERETALDDTAIFLDRNPSPADELIGRELFTRWLARTPAAHRRIIELWAEGYDQVEIARQLEVSLATIQRAIRKARGTLQELQAEEENA